MSHGPESCPYAAPCMTWSVVNSEQGSFELREEWKGETSLVGNVKWKGTSLWGEKPFGLLL